MSLPKQSRGLVSQAEGGACGGGGARRRAAAAGDGESGDASVCGALLSPEILTERPRTGSPRDGWAEDLREEGKRGPFPAERREGPEDPRRIEAAVAAGFREE